MRANAHKPTFAPATPSLPSTALPSHASVKLNSGSNPLTNAKLKVYLLAAIETIGRSWQDMADATIRNCFHHAGLCQEGTKVVSAVQGNSNFAHFWEELVNTLDAVLEKVGFEDFLTVDGNVALTATPLDSEIVADVMASGFGATDEPASRRSPSPDVARSHFCKPCAAAILRQNATS